MDDTELRTLLAELQEAAGLTAEIPRGQTRAALANVGLRVKYMRFDLEATRRENAALRRLLAVVQGGEE